MKNAQREWRQKPGSPNLNVCWQPRKVAADRGRRGHGEPPSDEAARACGGGAGHGERPMEDVTAVTTGDIGPRVGRRRLNRPAGAAAAGHEPDHAAVAPAGGASGRAAGLVLAVLALGCASTGAREAGERSLQSELERRGVSRVVVPFALSEEMAEWTRGSVGETGREERLDRLVELVTNASLLGVRYEAGYTGSAVEVFTERMANCLAFTQMFVGMARELDLAAYFVEVDVENFERSGDLIVVSDHVAVGFGPRHTMRVIDFGCVRRMKAGA